jgi:hypothetical protein
VGEDDFAEKSAADEPDIPRTGRWLNPFKTPPSYPSSMALADPASTVKVPLVFLPGRRLSCSIQPRSLHRTRREHARYWSPAQDGATLPYPPTALWGIERGRWMPLSAGSAAGGAVPSKMGYVVVTPARNPCSSTPTSTPKLSKQRASFSTSPFQSWLALDLQYLPALQSHTQSVAEVWHLFRSLDDPAKRLDEFLEAS